MILDGAMGTQLMRNGLDLPLPLWSADINITHPDIVRDVHKDYVCLLYTSDAADE